MKKVSFRVRKFDKEQFLTFNIDNNAELDDDLLDYLEEEEPEGIVPVIFEEGEEFDTFSYDITDKIHLSELSGQEIEAEMVLRVLRGLVISLMNMSEYRIPLSYLVLNRQYIYINSEYKVEFVCIPLEDMKEEVDLTHFLRNFIASLRFEPSENGDYVAKLLTYVNNRDIFNLHNLLEMLEEWMDRFGIEIPEGESNEIYGEYTEIVDEVDAVVDEAESDSDHEDNSAADNTDSYAENKAVDATDNYSDVTSDYNEYTTDSNTDNNASDDGSGIWESEKNVTEQQTYVEPIEDSIPVAEPIIENNIQEDTVVEEPVQEEDVVDEAESVEPETDQPAKTKNKKPRFKTKEAESVILEDELDAFLAEKEKEDHINNNIKIKKGIKINRASIVQNTKEELEHSEAEETTTDEEDSTVQNISEDIGSDDNGSDKKEKKTSKKENSKKEPVKRKGGLKKGNDETDEEKQLSGEDIGGDDVALAETKDEEEPASEELSDNAKPAANPIPKVNPYLIRVNTDERIMINKQTFKIGKAGMGVDYTITGNGAISRVHAIITGKDGEYFIKDNKSTNHTFVNGKSVEEGESEKLTNNCKIVLGDEEFIFKEQ